MASGSPDSRGRSDAEPPVKRARRDSEAPVVQRRQAACQPCRLRKVKCDKKRPACNLCTVSGQVCEYVGDAPEKISLETATATLLDRFDTLQKEIQDLKASLHSQNSEAVITSPVSVSVDARPRSPSAEASRDFLQIPPHRASADTVLQWTIFDGKYPPNALIGTLFSPDHPDVANTGDLIGSGITPLDEESIPALIDRFLQNVHTKNPILDVEALVKHGRRCADSGVGWDGSSCLVLMACALGAVAKPFAAVPVTETTSARLYAKELQTGDSCFTLACRRLGSLKYSLLAAQCHFFAGVYLMYTLRPMLSWHYFIQASIFCHMYLKMTHGLSADVLGNSGDRKARRLEQSLYWSCFKSECEFRVELPLQQSDISVGEYPDLFPSPPSPVAAGETAELRRHAAKLCNEEESWYYYLTEIALRRIGNRIVNTFFRQDPSSWMDIKPLLLMALEFEAQVSSWSAHLPPAMQHYETTSIIRAPDATGHVSRELSWAIDNRLLEMQTWLYQPFLYYLVHAGSVRSPAAGRNTRIGSLLNPFSPEPATTGLSAEDVSVLHSLIASGIECLLKTIDVRARGHRHHGLWYDLRSIMCAALILLAVVKSGNAAWIPGGVETLWGEAASPQYWTGSMPPIGGKVAIVLVQFDFWASEAPDLLKYKKVLEAVVRDVRGS